jgi:hypothetical protein
MNKRLPFNIKKPLKHFSHDEWERLCDRCGLCCIHKVEDQDGHFYLTDVACKFLDINTIQCRCYNSRDSKQSLCQSLTHKNIAKHLKWLPETCAYRRVYEQKPLPSWHPLITNDYRSVQKAGVIIQDKVVSENMFPVINWDEHIVPDDYFLKDIHYDH